MAELDIKDRHFYSRMGFGVGLAELELPIDRTTRMQQWMSTESPIAALSIPQSVSWRASTWSGAFMGEFEPMHMQPSQSDQLEGVRHEWIKMMARSEHTLRERVALFWHHHFACQVYQPDLAAQYINVLRQQALGSFRRLLHDVVKTPAMIFFLNNQQNRRGRPNENFARELMELFTLGAGNFTELDVQEAARAFTGWSTDGGSAFVFRPTLHDDGQKSFLGRAGRFGGEQIIDIILSQPQAARFLAARLYAYFVNETPVPAEVEAIADQLIKTDYDIGQTLKFLVESPFFYSTRHIGSHIKSPIELMVQLARLFDIRFSDDKGVAFLQRALGQVLLDPPNVAGWPGGRTWINNSTLMLRLNLCDFILNHKPVDHAVAAPLEAMEASRAVEYIEAKGSTERLEEHFSGTNYQDLPDKICQTLLVSQRIPVIALKKELRRRPEVLRDLIMRVVSLPEFQMG